MIRRLTPRLERWADVKVDDPTKISKTAYLAGCKLRGDVQIGDFSKVVSGVSIDGLVTIGANTSLNGPNLTIFSRINGVQIGNFCSIARNVSLQEYNHRYDQLSSYFVSANILKENPLEDIESNGAIIIGHDVWVGVGCTILSGVTIGNGAVVAANSVVTKDVLPYTLVGGVPAKKLKDRFEDEVIVEIEKLQWWDWSREKIKRNRHLFTGKLTVEKLNTIY